MLFNSRRLTAQDLGTGEFRRRFIWLPKETLDGRIIWLEYAVQYREVNVRWTWPIGHPIYYWTDWRTMSRSDIKKLCADGHIKPTVDRDGNPIYQTMRPIYDILSAEQISMLSDKKRK